MTFLLISIKLRFYDFNKPQHYLTHCPFLTKRFKLNINSGSDKLQDSLYFLTFSFQCCLCFGLFDQTFLPIVLILKFCFTHQNNN